MYLFNCITRLLSENALPVNVFAGPKNSENLQKSTFILIFHQYVENWVRKSYFWSYLRFYDCLLTGWLPTTSILVETERIYRYQFKSNDLKHHRPFPLLFFHFSYVYDISNVLKKNEPDRSVISEAINYEISAYLNA